MTEAALPPPAHILDILLRSARQHPGAPALLAPGRPPLPYEDLAAQTACFAH